MIMYVYICVRVYTCMHIYIYILLPPIFMPCTVQSFILSFVSKCHMVLTQRLLYEFTHLLLFTTQHLFSINKFIANFLCIY